MTKCPGSDVRIYGSTNARWIPICSSCNPKACPGTSTMATIARLIFPAGLSLSIAPQIARAIPHPSSTPGPDGLSTALIPFIYALVLSPARNMRRLYHVVLIFLAGHEIKLMLFSAGSLAS
jgi:hypothetical protein